MPLAIICPFARGNPRAVRLAGKAVRVRATALCVAGDCMAWAPAPSDETDADDDGAQRGRCLLIPDAPRISIVAPPVRGL